MSEWRLSVPVVFIIFNRPDTTSRVFAEIAKAKPPKLLVIADGPKEGNVAQAEACRQTRAIVESVNWRCEVITHYSDVNLGCRRRVSSGLDWAFEMVPQAIILEDDCLPHPTFFRYCEEMLLRYRDDERVSMICGDNFQFGRQVGSGSYYFSKYAHIWGWASWRRAWRNYDVSAGLWPEFASSGRFDRMTLPCEREHWQAAFSGVHAGSIDTWDYQWTLSCWCQSMFAVMPQVNLISNIGFGPRATHTKDLSIYANMPMAEITWPLTAPAIFAPSAEADAFTAQKMFGIPVTTRIARRIRRAVFS